ncbi:NAD-dependent succinate-semialdehyde dehydrogenase [Arthrobacter globiformis]|uniref:NAD-dependent succinate-semialdehyde dehydrogenase n=1 Tax=Arthrobacter globiformis TaxID=1665 RepID=UPI002784F364|nr:NAD-dependent succinate-semialdehyde dehydrogenase [Arthrobacter globiformis]MDQ0864628.1 succinate-semialdehyde dehydrogenase/glutarate-semialdehyde dehydrogenase [Arthrobacter globiformis]
MAHITAPAPLPVLGFPAKLMPIGGSWIPSSSGQTITVINPATEQPIADVPAGTVTDGLAGLDAACAAQDAWAATPARDRADILARTYQGIIDRRDEFAALIVAEMGKPWIEAQAEVDYGAGFFRWFAESANRLHLDGQFGLEPGGNYRIAVSKRPVGPSLLITPWNFPLAMGARKIAPALAAGCTTILKPAELTPLTSMLLARVLEEAGVPAGVVNIVTTNNSREVVAAIMNDSRVRKISFTGSTQVGRALLAQAAENVMNTSMELGGNAPLIVFDDADLDQAVDGAIVAKLRNGGQSCVGANRIYLQSGIATEFTRRFTERMSATRTGNGVEPDVELGPLVDDKQVTAVSALVQDALAKGATCLTGGTTPEGTGYFYPATVLTNIPANANIRTEEIFGPVAAIYTFDTEDQAIQEANNTPYGLASYVFSQDLGRALRVADAIDAGMTGINRGVVSNPAAPFGGTKASGLGREGGTEGLEAYQETKYTGIQL